MNWLNRTSLLLLGGLLTCSVLIGCGQSHPPTYQVSGQVVFPDGQPLKTGGKIVFVSTTSPDVRATGYFGSDGKFQLSTYGKEDGAIAGEHQVMIYPTVPDDGDGMSPREYAMAMQPIAERYSNPRGSGLKFTVSAETAPHDFKVEVTRPGARR